MVLKFRVTTSEDKVINIKKKDYGMASYFLGIDIRVRMTSRKVGVKKKAIRFCIPSLRIFLNNIERFIKVTYKPRFILKISKRLFHVDFFL